MAHLFGGGLGLRTLNALRWLCIALLSLQSPSSARAALLRAAAVPAIGSQTDLLSTDIDADAPQGDAISAYLHDVTSSGAGPPPIEQIAERVLHLPARNATLEAAAPRRIVVVAKYDEDTTWLQKLPSNFDVVVYQSRNSSEPHFVRNLGNEAAKYLSYIVEHYDELPDSVAFLQAGRQDWHDPWPKDVMLRSWDWGRASQQGGLASLPTNAPCLVEDSVRLAAHEPPAAPATEQCVALTEHYPKQMAAIREVWPSVFERDLGPLPQRWLTHCCAQFAVTREAVQRHSHDFYRSLLEWVIQHDQGLESSGGPEAMARNHDPGRRDAGHILEPLWVLLFAPPDSSATHLPEVDVSASTPADDAVEDATLSEPDIDH